MLQTKAMQYYFYTCKNRSYIICKQYTKAMQYSINSCMCKNHSCTFCNTSIFPIYSSISSYSYILSNAIFKSQAMQYLFLQVHDNLLHNMQYNMPNPSNAILKFSHSCKNHSYIICNTIL